MFKKIPHIQYAFVIAMLFATGTWAQDTQEACEAAGNNWMSNYEYDSNWCGGILMRDIIKDAEKIVKTDDEDRCFFATEITVLGNNGGQQFTVNGVENVICRDNSCDLSEINKADGGYYIHILKSKEATGSDIVPGIPLPTASYCQEELKLDPEDLVGYPGNTEACNYTPEMCGGTDFSAVKLEAGSQNGTGCYFATDFAVTQTNAPVTINGIECRANNSETLCSKLLTPENKIDGGYYIYYTNNAQFTTTVAHLPIAKCIASFNGNGGVNVPGQVKGAKGGHFSEPAKTPTKDGFGFAGWFDGEEEWNFETSEVNGDITLVAKWVESVTVTFDLSGGNIDGVTEIPELTELNIGSKVTNPGNPEKANLTFDGWFDGENKWDFEANTVSKNTNLKAKFTAEVIFNINGGSIDENPENPESQTVFENAFATKPSDPNGDLTFLGWFAPEAVLPWNFEIEPVTKNITLTAKYGALITFDENGGTEIPNQPVETGTLTVEPEEVPTKIDLTFKDWYLEDATEPFVFGQELTENITLVAKWYATVTFDGENPTDVDEGELLAKPDTDPTKEDLTFAGWYLEEEEFNFDTPITGNLMITSKWTATVAFDLNGGSIGEDTNNPATLTVFENALATNPGNAEKADLTFLGWFAPEATLPWDFENEEVTKDITLTAKYGAFITFDVNGGDEIPNQPVEDGAITVKPEDPTKTNLLFKGWYLEDETEPFEFGEILTENITLIAKWYATVTFDGENSIDVDEGELVAKPVTDPTDENLVFSHWKTPAGEEWDFEAGIIDGTVTNEDGVLALTSHWKATVTFANTGEAAIDPQEVEIGATATEPTETLTHETYSAFIGWYLEDATEPFDFDNTPITENITLTAKWGWIVTFDVSGGNNAPDAQNVLENEVATKPEDPTKDGLTFAGWFKDGQDEAVDFDEDDIIVEDITYTAKWIATVTFANLGETFIDTVQVFENETVTEPEEIPVKDGLTFVGWNVGEDEFNFDTPITENITISALFQAQVTFDVNGGEFAGEDAVMVNEGEVIGAIEEPTKDELTFIGWFNGDNEWDLANDVVETNMTLTAKYGAVITFEPNNTEASFTEVIEEGATTTEPEAPTKADLTFKGWYAQDATEQFVFGSELTASITLTAKWYATVTFNGGTPIDVDEGAPVAKPTDPTNGDSLFVGWFNGENEYNFDNAVTGNLNLTSKWSAKTVPIRIPQFAGSNIHIQAIGNNIVVNNLPANVNVEVFNMRGQSVGQIGLSKGLYLVKVNGYIAKVAVK